VWAGAVSLKHQSALSTGFDGFDGFDGVLLFFFLWVRVLHVRECFFPWYCEGTVSVVNFFLTREGGGTGGRGAGGREGLTGWMALMGLDGVLW
jgi:hypothetical protein